MSVPATGDIRKVAFASLIGTAIEWYDFFIYASAATLVFNTLFFPQFDPLTGTLFSLGTFGVAFVARPVGGLVFGHFGDRIGRKTSLVLTLAIMGACTGAIGLLPTYSVLGVWAPILLSLLRFGQGFAVGGEWGGAVLMAVEHAPAHKRGFYGSWPQMGSPLGLIASSGVMGLIALLPEEALFSWGWRIPFLLGFALLGAGLLIRLRISESPAFAGVTAKSSEHKVPVAELFRSHKLATVVGTGTMAAVNIGFYILSVFVLSYGTTSAGFSKSQISLIVMIAAAVDLIALGVFAALSDRIDRRLVFVFGAIFLGLWAWPFFLLIDTGDPVLAGIALVVGFVLGHAPAYATQSTLLADLFDVRVRYTGTSVSYALGSVLWSAPVPIIAASLVAGADGFWPVALMLIGGTVVTVVATSLVSAALRARSACGTSNAKSGPVVEELTGA